MTGVGRAMGALRLMGEMGEMGEMREIKFVVRMG